MIQVNKAAIKYIQLGKKTWKFTKNGILLGLAWTTRPLPITEFVPERGICKMYIRG